MEMYLRFPLKEHCIGGYIELEAGTICRLEEENDWIVAPDGLAICLTQSEIARNFCPNTPHDIYRATLLDQILPLDPPEINEYYAALGEYTQWGWKWYESILTAPLQDLEQLLKNITK